MKNYKFCITLILLFASYGSTNLALAINSNEQEMVKMEDPVQFLHSKVDMVLNELKVTHNKGPNLPNIKKIVDDFIIPNVDFDEMCQRIAGRAIWNKANTSDKEEFIKELKELLINTYATTLKNYTEEKIEFQIYSGKINSKRIQIKSTVIRNNQENLSVDYRLVANGNSWKVYDLIIEGVSILNGFNAQFSDQIKMYGLKLATTKIREHNKNNVKKSF